VLKSASSQSILLLGNFLFLLKELKSFSPDVNSTISTFLVSHSGGETLRKIEVRGDFEGQDLKRDYLLNSFFYL
jgi:hypothetical protein